MDGGFNPVSASAAQIRKEVVNLNHGDEKRKKKNHTYVQENIETPHARHKVKHTKLTRLIKLGVFALGEVQASIHFLQPDQNRKIIRKDLKILQFLSHILLPLNRKCHNNLSGIIQGRCLKQFICERFPPLVPLETVTVVLN